MKEILTAAVAFALIFTATACSDFEHPDTSVISETTTHTDTISTTTSSESEATHTTTSVSTTVSVTASSSEISSSETSPVISSEDTWKTLMPYTEVDIPFVAWTEVNLQKTMYTISRCKGYDLALTDAKAKMIYDPGIALEVLARTSTDFYRIRGDIYIPCDFLDNVLPEGIDEAAATSCTVYTAPPVSTASGSAAALPVTTAK